MPTDTLSSRDLGICGAWTLKTRDRNRATAEWSAGILPAAGAGETPALHFAFPHLATEGSSEAAEGLHALRAQVPGCPPLGDDVRQALFGHRVPRCQHLA